MKGKAKLVIVPTEKILNQIYTLRGHKVMLDIDLANLYKVENRALKQAVKRNRDLFPADFMFVLTKTEVSALLSQGAINSKQHLGGSLPFVFTESGVAMLSGVLKSDRAKEMNIAIMRAFVVMRRMLIDNTELRLAIEELRKKTESNKKNIEMVFQYLDKLIDDKEKQVPRKKIGYPQPRKR